MTTRINCAVFMAPETGGRAARVRSGAFSLLLGLAFTVLLFGGIAYFERTAPAAPPVEFSDLGVAVLPLEPPPVPAMESAAVAVEPTGPGFELAPSESPVKLAVVPPPLETVLAEDLSKMPAASFTLGLPADFRPKAIARGDPQHVFQRMEVDMPASLLVRTVPTVSRRIMDGNSALHLTFFWIVEIDGTVSNASVASSSGNEQLDALMLDMIRNSVFSPAMKGGRKVRMMTQQRIDIRWSDGSRFNE
jgi:TonB family protein